MRVAPLYSGISPALLSIIPSMALTFAFFDALGAAWDSAADRRSSLRALLCGALSGTLAKLAVYPLDTVKKRAQVRGMSRAPELGEPLSLYRSSFHALVTIAREEGVVRGWYKGTTPSLLKAGLSAGLTFAAKEALGDALVMSRVGGDTFSVASEWHK